MAARENQGYLIAVIILVLLSLVLALVSFLGIQKAYEQADLAESSDNKAYLANKISEAEGLKAEAYAAMIGIGVAPAELEQSIRDLRQLTGDTRLDNNQKEPIKKILEDVEKAREAYEIDTTATVSVASETSAGEATFRSRQADLTALVDRLRKDNLIQKKVGEEAERKSAETIAQANETIESANKEVENLTTKLSEQKEAALANEEALKKEVQAGEKSRAELSNSFEEFKQKSEFELRTEKEQNSRLVADNRALKIRLDRYEKTYFDNADGEVIRVASALNTVFIDIGRQDGLTLNRKFTIYDQSVTDFENSESKGFIEVIRVGDFRSEARITQQSAIDPILRGDHILTATWDPGFSVQIALAGRFDLDGDRFDDTQKLTRMIERNGGRVVAGHNQEGEIHGKMHPGIRFLVKGNEELVGNADDPNAGSILQAVRAMEADAEKNTVQVIDLQKLLNRMGVRNQPKTQRLGFPPGGFAPREPRGTAGSGSRPSADGSDNRPAAGSGTR